MAARIEIPQTGPGGRRSSRAEDVLREAQARPEGLELLASAAAEYAAIAFGVHPDVVLAARELARSRGLAASDPAEP